MDKTIEEYEKSIEQIQYLLKNEKSLTDIELRNLSRTLNVVESNLKMKLFQKVFESKDTTSILTEIDEKIAELTNEIINARQNIDDLKDNKTIFIGSKKDGLIIDNCSFLIEQLSTLKNRIVEKDYNHLVSELFKKEIKEQQALIDSCGGALHEGNFKFAQIYGDALIKISATNSERNLIPNYEAIGNLFAINEDKELISELKSYVEKKEKEELLLQKEEAYKKAIEVLDTIIDKFPVPAKLTNFFQKEKVFDSNPKSEPRIMNDYQVEELKRLSRNILTKKLNKTKIKELEDNIEEFKKSEKNFSNLKEEVNILGIGDILSNLGCENEHSPIKRKKGFSYSVENSEVIYEMIVIKKLMSVFEKKNATGFEMNEIYEKLISEERKVQQEQVEIEQNNLSPKAKELLTRDEAGVRMATNFDKCKKSYDQRYDETPIIAAYILKVIGETKKMPYEEMIKTVNYAHDNHELESEYNEIVDKYIVKVREDIGYIIPDEENHHKL